MARVKRWIENNHADGIGSVELTSWKYYHDFIYFKLLNYRDYMYRGHRCDNWNLEPTLDRLLRKKKQIGNQFVRDKHLENFKYAVRGRRGTNPPELRTANDWWALGQHNGLATPLLDWTTSPFVAAYFAFAESFSNDTSRRVIYAIHAPSIINKANELCDIAIDHDELPPDVPEIFKPLSDENPRLVNQGGLFSRTPDGIDLEKWIKINFKGERNYILMKIFLPNHDRLEALKSLNRMNINHLSLFPDLFGASQFCNLDLQIDEY